MKRTVHVGTDLLAEIVRDLTRPESQNASEIASFFYRQRRFVAIPITPLAKEISVSQSFLTFPIDCLA